MSGSPQQRIEAVAARQRGQINRRQLRAIGLSRWVIQRLTEQAHLFSLEAAVFAVGYRAPTPLSDETTALLAVDHPRTLLGRASAARRWDMPMPFDDDGRVHVVLPFEARSRARSFTIHRTRILTAADARMRDGLPVTSPARTLLDLADAYTDRQLELALDRLLVDRTLRLEEVRALLARAPGLPGARRLRGLLDTHTATTLTRSQAEELFLRLLRDAHLAPPLVNSRQAGLEVDFCWPAQRLVVEIDGHRYHSSRRAFENDRRREAALRAAGFTVIRFSFDQLRCEPLAVIAGVTRALTQVATVSAPSSREMATSTE